MVGTFHRICGRILRREASYLPVDHNFVIFDSDDQLTLIKRVIKEKRLNDKDYRPRQVHSLISKAKNDLLAPDEFPIEGYRDEVIAEIYQAYQAYLVASNAMDFDDMLLYTATLLETYPEVRKSMPSASRISWWTNSRIPTWRSISCSLTWHRSIRTSLWLVMRTSRFIAGAVQTITMWKDLCGTIQSGEDPSGTELSLHPEDIGWCGCGDQ